MDWKYETNRDNYKLPFCCQPYFDDDTTNRCGNIGEEFNTKINSSVGLHTHQSIELLYILDGSMKLELMSLERSERIIELKKNDVMLINCNVLHDTVDHLNSVYHAAFIPPGCLPPPLGIEAGKTHGSPYCDSDHIILELVRQMAHFSSLEETRAIDSILMTSLASAILSILQPRMKDSLFELRGSAIKSDILTYVYKSFRDPELCANQVARIFGYSPRYLQNLFREKVGMGFRDYLDRLRINEAQSLLVTTDQSIESISFSVGYESQRSFFRKFKDKTGMTPGEWRTAGRHEQ